MALSDVGRTVRAAATGNSVAWAALVDEYSDLVWAVLRSHGLPRPDAEDAFQTTWMRFGEGIASLAEADGVARWLAKTAREEALATLTRRELELPVAVLREEAFVDTAPDGLSAVALQQADRALWEAFDDLRPMCKILLVMLSTEPAMSYAEISATLGIPIGSIGPTRQRCLERLRRNRHVRDLGELLVTEG